MKSFSLIENQNFFLSITQCNTFSDLCAISYANFLFCFLDILQDYSFYIAVNSLEIPRIKYAFNFFITDSLVLQVIDLCDLIDVFFQREMNCLLLKRPH